MEIFVCIKQVPARDSQLRVSGQGDWIEEGDLGYEMNEPDAFALEEGLRLKEKHGGQVTVVSAGPASASTRTSLCGGGDP
jgi:electron transfer flavoprotein beta subunit